MLMFLLGLIIGVPFTFCMVGVVLIIYDRIHKDKPLTKDEWDIM